MPILNLPNYLLYDIFSFVRLCDVIQLSMTSKNLNVTIDNEHWWSVCGMKCNLKLNKKAKKYKTWKSLIIKNYYDLCQHCTYSIGTPYCINCKNLLKQFYINKFIPDNDEYDKICKSIGLKKYHLTQKDIDNLSYELKRNPHYGSSSQMQLYDEYDLYVKMLDKYGSPYGYELIQQRKNMIKNKKISNKKLKLYDLNINYDMYKEYCDKFLNGSISLVKLQDIVKNFEKRRKIIDEQLEANKLDKNMAIGLYNRFIKNNCVDINSTIKRIMTKRDRKNKIDELGIKTDYYGVCKKFLGVGGNFLHVKNVIQRGDMLVDELKKYNINLRDDSVICKEYILFGDKLLDDVVDIMVEMDWLHKNTTYSECRTNIYRNNYHYLSSHEISNKAKKMALDIWCKYNDKNQDLPKNINKIIKNINVKSYVKMKKNISCLCGNCGSPECIDNLCKNCCSNVDCKRHF